MYDGSLSPSLILPFWWSLLFTVSSFLRTFLEDSLFQYSDDLLPFPPNIYEVPVRIGAARDAEGAEYLAESPLASQGDSNHIAQQRANQLMAIIFYPPHFT